MFLLRSLTAPWREQAMVRRRATVLSPRMRSVAFANARSALMRYLPCAVGREPGTWLRSDCDGESGHEGEQ
ncbi:hypothetical protein BN2537_15145 [Streptomyces venezuelae]|nr:hypothetical protein BN2537_15145 [Streptomyces venezuelae]